MGDVEVRRRGPWSPEQVDHFFEETVVPLRLACNGKGAHPVLVSLWFTLEDGVLWCATQRSALVTRLLERDPHCAFEVSIETPPYRGVRGQAVAKLHADRGEPMLRRLLGRYLGGEDSELARMLLARAADEVAIALAPRTLTSWDFSERMKGAV